MDLIDQLAGAERWIVVDALTTGSPPGTCTLADVTGFPARTVAEGCAHPIKAAQLIDLARDLACDGTPQEVTIAGIEREASCSDGPVMSDEVTAAVPRLVDLILLAVGAGLQARIMLDEVCGRGASSSSEGRWRYHRVEECAIGEGP